MHVLRSLWLTALLLAAAPAFADDAALMVLEPVGLDKPMRVEIRTKPGAYVFPPPPVTAPRWRITAAGNAGGAQPPPERVAEFLRKAGDGLEPFCRVQVRYFRHAEGWRAAFRLDETPLFMRDATGRWRPLTLPGGDPALLQRFGAALPNADGFYPELEFGLTTGAVAIDSWIVR